MGKWHYSYQDYKDHYVCFACRKTFKQANQADRFVDAVKPRYAVVCPQCGKPMFQVGKDFKAPAKNDVKAWKRIEEENLRRFDDREPNL